MPTFPRRRFLKYIILTFLFFFAYSFLVPDFDCCPNVSSDFVVMVAETANHNRTSLFEFIERKKATQQSVNSNEGTVVLQTLSIPPSQELDQSEVTELKLNATDQQTRTPHSNSRASIKYSGNQLEKRIELSKSAVPHSPKSPAKFTVAQSPMSSAKSAVPQSTASLAKSSASSKEKSVPAITSKNTTNLPLGDDDTWNFTASNNPHPYKFLKNASDICRASSHIFVLNIIHSKSSNFAHRNIIRKTWGSTTMNEKLRTVTVFALGQTNDSKIEAALDAEYQKYHDIVQEDFLDSYRNLTHKAVAVLRWIVNFCPAAEFVLKTDDDIFVNPYNINRLIHRHLLKEPNATKIMCELSRTDVIRRKQSTWYVPEEEYPYKRYPPYCRGAAFIMPKSIVPLLYNASHTTKFFWIDDVYSTGMLAHVVNVSHLDIVQKFVYNDTERRDKLLFGDAAIAHIYGGPNVEKKVKLWDEILKIEMNLT